MKRMLSTCTCCVLVLHYKNTLDGFGSGFGFCPLAQTAVTFVPSNSRLCMRKSVGTAESNVIPNQTP